MRRIILAAVLAGVSMAYASAAEDEKATAEFYAKKTVTIAVGFSPGGNYDLYARLVARHIGQHIPASPPSSCRTCQAPAVAVLPMY